MRICFYSVANATAIPAPFPFGEREQRRLDAIKNPLRKAQSLAALLALRELTGERPSPIHRNADGKPFFEDRRAPNFSLSHTDELAVALIGDADSGRVGVDLERIRPYPQATGIAHRFFAKEEWEAFSAMGETEEAFFRLWTEKEALAKMAGTGLRFTENEAPRAEFRKCVSIEYGGNRYCVTVCAERAATLEKTILLAEGLHMIEYRSQL